MNDKFFPLVMIALSLAASIIYFATHQWRQAWYFLFAALLTATQIF